MKQAWSLFWLLVLSCVAVVIFASWIEPYIGIIVTTFVVVLLAIIGYRVYRYVRAGRRSY